MSPVVPLPASLITGDVLKQLGVALGYTYRTHTQTHIIMSILGSDAQVVADRIVETIGTTMPPLPVQLLIQGGTNLGHWANWWLPDFTFHPHLSVAITGGCTVRVLYLLDMAGLLPVYDPEGPQAERLSQWDGMDPDSRLASLGLPLPSSHTLILDIQPDEHVYIAS